MNSLVLIGSGCLVALMPLALYFLFLAFLNQRPRPTMFTGVWDFTLLLLGLSGFILVGGPVLLAIVDSNWRSYWFSGNGNVQKAWNASSGVSSAIACGYLLVLAMVIGVGLYVRRSVTVIYNLEPAVLDPLLVGSLESRQLVWARVLGGYEISVRKSSVDPSLSTRAAEIARLRVDSFPSFHHACLKWENYDPMLRQEIEAELDKHIQATESPANPVGSWFKTGAVLLLTVMLCWMGFLIYMIVVPPKGF